MASKPLGGTGNQAPIEVERLSQEMPTAVLLTLTGYLIGYLLGSIPLIHLLARWQGVDLQRVGTGNIGGGNLLLISGTRIGSIGLLLDLGRGILPPLLVQSLGLPLWAEAGAATGAVAGQMWPLFYGFKGGRGNMTALGALLVLSPLAVAIALIPVVVGVSLSIRNALRHDPGARFWGVRNSRSVPLGVLFALVVMPFVSLALSQGAAVAISAAAILILMLVRRATASWQETEATASRKILLYRLLYDRPHP